MTAQTILAFPDTSLRDLDADELMTEGGTSAGVAIGTGAVTAGGCLLSGGLAAGPLGIIGCVGAGALVGLGTYLL